ncbi:MAG: hypothetical protein KF900_11060 [Bacteroidetes bacterium]|nr:hypothetical protein [Bacteroidota bacterium]
MENNKQDDLDIVYVIKALKNGVLSLFRSMAWLINFSFKKALVLLPFVFLGIGAGILLRNFQKTYYASELTVSHVRFENDFCREMIDNLNLYITDDGINEALADALHIDINIAGSVKSFSYYPFSSNFEKLYKDSVKVMLPFKVGVEIYDNKILPELQTGILDYLENNAYASKLKEIDQTSLDKMEQRVTAEIREIDSLKNIVNQAIIPRGNGTGIILGEPINPVHIYQRAQFSYEKLLEVNKKKALNNSFQVVISFNKNDVPVNRGYKFYSFFSALAGYAAGLLFLFLRKNGKINAA